VLRFLAFFTVYLNHAYAIPLLWIGVDVFFILSGLLITDRLLDSKDKKFFFRNFYVRRAFRIFPPYYLYLLIIFIGTEFFELLPEISITWSWYILYISNFKESFLNLSPRILLQLWSLAVEEQFYLIWPLVIYFTPIRRLMYVTAILIVSAPIVRGIVSLSTDNFQAVYTMLPCRIDLLSLGSLIAIARRTQKGKNLSSERWGKKLMIYCFFTFFFLTLVLDNFKASGDSIVFNTIGFSLLCFGLGGAVLYSLSIKTEKESHGTENNFLIGKMIRNALNSLFTSRKLAFLGKISYASYLFHELILFLLLKGAGIQEVNFGTVLSDMRIIFIGIVGFVLTILVSMVSWKFLESPLLQFRDSKYKNE
jgi:peptidoglycan/LPS O-acetylase OafA/YrhL